MLSPARSRGGGSTRKQGGSPEPDDGEGANAAAAFSKSLVDCRTAVEEIVQASILGVIETLHLDPSGRKVGDLQPIFDRLLRLSVEQAERLSSSHSEAHRKALKAQATVFKVKLESSRTAGQVQMKNQAAELQANFAVTLQQKMADASAGGASELKAALEKNAELQEALDAATNNASRSEEMLKTLRGLLRDKEKDEVKVQKEKDELKTDLETARANERTARVANEQARLLQSALQEAAAEAERAAFRPPQECKSLTAKLAVRLRGEIKAMHGGDVEDAQSRLSRLLADMEALNAKLVEAEAELAKRGEENAASCV